VIVLIKSSANLTNEFHPFFDNAFDALPISTNVSKEQSKFSAFQNQFAQASLA